LAQTRDINENSQKLHPEDQFLRIISPIFYDPVKRKVLSGAFQNTSGTNRMSVNSRKLSSIEDTLYGYPGHGVDSITAQLCWLLQQEIEETPVERNSAHCDVVGHKPLSIRRKFRDMADYLRYPES